jgi:hypothetical protein
VAQTHLKKAIFSTSCGCWVMAVTASMLTVLPPGTPVATEAQTCALRSRYLGWSRLSRSGAHGCFLSSRTFVSLPFTFCGSMCCLNSHSHKILMHQPMASKAGMLPTAFPFVACCLDELDCYCRNFHWMVSVSCNIISRASAHCLHPSCLHFNAMHAPCVQCNARMYVCVTRGFHDEIFMASGFLYNGRHCRWWVGMTSAVITHAFLEVAYCYAMLYTRQRVPAPPAGQVDVRKQVRPAFSLSGFKNFLFHITWS